MQLKFIVSDGIDTTEGTVSVSFHSAGTGNSSLNLHFIQNFPFLNLMVHFNLKEVNFQQGIKEDVLCRPFMKFN